MQVGFLGLLTLLFVALKLTHVIDWEWVWVLAPLWIGVIIGALFFIGVMVAGWLSLRDSKKGRRW